MCVLITKTDLLKACLFFISLRSLPKKWNMRQFEQTLLSQQYLSAGISFWCVGAEQLVRMSYLLQTRADALGDVACRLLPHCAGGLKALLHYAILCELSCCARKIVRKVASMRKNPNSSRLDFNCAQQQLSRPVRA